MGAIRAWLVQWGLVLALVLAGAGWGAMMVQTMRLAWLKAEVAEDLAKATTKAREREHEWNLLWKENEDAKQAQLRAVRTDFDAALERERLRNRPGRLPEAARAACQGATGRELSGGDAEVLVRLAARADELRTELSACYQREDALTR